MSSEKDLFRRALAQEQWRVEMDAAMKARISARVVAERRRRERRADRWSWVAVGFLGGVMVAAFAVVTADFWSAMADSAREIWFSVSDRFAELGRQIAQSVTPEALPLLNIVLTIFGYSLLALWIDVRRAKRDAGEKQQDKQ